MVNILEPEFDGFKFPARCAYQLPSGKQDDVDANELSGKQILSHAKKM
jgi:hypothetical protein